jgi:predicted DNA-binding transcriptional regulator YafY
MRASRLVSILLLLQTRNRMTADELAAALEVSVRTIYRDVESLNAAGVPVYGEPGHEGGYQLVAGYRTRLTGLTGAEAESLFLTGLPTAAAELGLGPTVTSTQLKLMAALPPELRDRAGRVAERFYFDAPSWYRDADQTPHLAAVADAVWGERSVRLRYVRWAAPHELTRVVDPYGLVLKAGVWYLVASHDNQPRTYRVSRILEAEVLAHTFVRPDFDLAGHWREYLADFDRRRHTSEAVLRLSAAGLARLAEVMEPAVVAAVRRTAVPDGDGFRVTVPVEVPEQALAMLFRLGADVEIVAPESLRTQMIDAVAALSHLYGKSAAESRVR